MSETTSTSNWKVIRDGEGCAKKRSLSVWTKKLCCWIGEMCKFRGTFIFGLHTLSEILFSESGEKKE